MRAPFFCGAIAAIVTQASSTDECSLVWQSRSLALIVGR
jgi:hypothetical protein